MASSWPMPVAPALASGTGEKHDFDRMALYVLGYRAPDVEGRCHGSENS